MRIYSLSPATETEYENIRQIIIYGHGEKLYTAARGSLEESRIRNGKISMVYNGKIRGIYLATEPKRARKENLNRTDNYFLTYHGNYSWEHGLTLYIHESEISVSHVGEYVAFCHNGETNYKTAVNLHFNNGASVHRLKMEKLPEAGKDFTPPDGCKWRDAYSPDPEHPNYDLIYPGRLTGEESAPVVVKKWIQREIVHDVLIESTFYTRTEKEPERLERDRIAEAMTVALNSSRFSFSHYDVEKLLKVFNITFKDGGETK